MIEVNPAWCETNEMSAPNSNSSKYHLHIWHNLAFSCPPDWEVLHFSKDPFNGRVILGDRESHRLEITWKRGSEEPDMRRLISDEQSRFETNDRVTRVRALEHKDWLGIEVEAENFLSTRFARFFPGSSYLIEAVFLWPKRIDTNLQNRVLENIKKLPESPHRWKAFGLDIIFAQDWKLQECSVLPAAAKLRFKPEENSLEELFFQRVGMLDSWLTGSVEDWLRNQIPQDRLTITSSYTDRVCSHTVSCFKGTQRRPGGIGRIIAPLSFYCAAWICPQDGRLYHVRTLLKKPCEGLAMTCCSDLEIRP